jgi:diaminopimelate epimerase
MQALRFEKYEGLGNDFVIVESERDDAISPARARAICDRRFGVGADGVLLVLPPSPGAQGPTAARMRVVNADGSIPEMCGNGLRCAVLYVARKRGLRACELTFETDAGPRKSVLGEDGQVTVDMGVVRVGREVTVDLDGDAWTFTTADAGNPHAVSTRRASPERFAEIGPRLTTHPSFPGGTNVELATFGDRTIDLDVWERGAGRTLACGTGACATAAVGVAKGAFRTGDEIAVTLPGGVLFVTITSEHRAIMRGPARRTFAGEVDLDEVKER